MPDYPLFYKSIFKEGDKIMRKRAALCFLLLFVFLNMSGCVPLIVGGAAGALGAKAISKATIQGDTDKPYDSIWNAALTVSRIRGTIKQEDSQKGYIELETERSQVWIRLIRLTYSTTRLRIEARKYQFPNLDLAQDMYVKIMEEVK